MFFCAGAFEGFEYWGRGIAVRRGRRTLQINVQYISCRGRGFPSRTKRCYFASVTATLPPTPHPPQTQRLRSPFPKGKANNLPEASLCLCRVRRPRRTAQKRCYFIPVRTVEDACPYKLTFNISLVGEGFPLPHKNDVTLGSLV